MSSKVTQWVLEFVDKISSPMKQVDGNVKKATEGATKFGDCLRRINAINWQATRMGVEALKNGFGEMSQVGANFDASMRQVSAITGVTGKDLDKLGDQARQLAKEFGSSATSNMEVFQTVLSRLGPQIGDNATALGNMGKYANTLSKTMGGDVTGAVDALTTSLLQFQVDLNDPITAAKEMESMMNVIAAGAKYGAAEVPQISAAIEQAGVAANLAGVSFAEANAAIQTMAGGGKYGSEAGIAIRNVITSMSAEAKLNKKAADALRAYGIDMQKVSDATIPFADRLKMLQPVQNDINALTLMFGRENAAAAQILIRSAEEQEDLTQKITGTNVAYEQAQTVMEGWTEKLSRFKQKIDDIKIGTFGLTSVLDVVFGTAASGFALLANFSTVYSGFGPILKSATVALKGWALWAKITTAANWLLNLSLWANPITWVVGGVMVAVGAFVLLWNKVEGFRAVLTGMWEVLKTFGKIIKDFVVDRIKGFLNGIGALGKAISELFSGNFKEAWASAKEGVNGIIGVDAVKNAYNNAKSIGENFQKGYNEGVEAFRASNGIKSTSGDTSGFTGYAWTGDGIMANGVSAPAAIGAKSVTQGKNAATLTPKRNATSSSGEGGKELSLSGGGSSGGGKSITMNLTINNHLNGVKNPDEFVEIVVRKINDRLSDALAVAI